MCERTPIRTRGAAGGQGQVPPVTLGPGPGGTEGRELDEDDILDLIDERYLTNADDPYSDQFYEEEEEMFGDDDKTMAQS